MFLVSNDVLEKEMSAVTEQIARYREAGREPPEDLVDREQAVQLQLKLLEMEVQTERLTMEGYLERVRKAMERDKLLAVKLKRANRLEEAKQVLFRYKTMQPEYDGAMASMT